MVKLKFKVINCQGEDPDYPVSELNVHSPQTKGWQSPRFCEFPQEIGLQFLDGTVRIQQIQLLSHQSKIATRVEIFMGVGEDYSTAKFQRLGYLSLDSNDRSGFRARELKSVYIDATGQYLKLCMHKCFINKYNLYNQVGLIAINALGEPGDSSSSNNNNNRNSKGKHSMSAAARPNEKLNDLAFDMAFDAETAEKIRNISAAKNACVANEDYEAAKALKTVEQQMKAIGVQLAKMEVQKSTAVQREDYDAASSLKSEIERLRSGIEGRLNNIPAYGAFLDGKVGGVRPELFRQTQQKQQQQPRQQQQRQQQQQRSQQQQQQGNPATREQQDIMQKQQELERQRKQLTEQQEAVRLQAEQQKEMLRKQQMEMQRQMQEDQRKSQDMMSKAEEMTKKAEENKNAPIQLVQSPMMQNPYGQPQMMGQQGNGYPPGAYPPGAYPPQQQNGYNPQMQQQQPPMQQQQQQPIQQPRQQQQQQQQPPQQVQQQTPQQTQQPPQQQQQEQQQQQQQEQQQPPEQPKQTPQQPEQPIQQEQSQSQTPPQQQQQQVQQTSEPDPFKSSKTMQRDGSKNERGIPRQEQIITNETTNNGGGGGGAASGGVRRTPPRGARRGAPGQDQSTGLPGSPQKRSAPPMSLAPGERHPLEGVQGYQNLIDPEPIPPAMATEAKELSDVFGTYVIQCFYSKTWQLREAALSKILLDMPRILNEEQIPMGQLFVLTCRMLQTCSGEKVANVFARSIDFLKIVLTGVAASIHRSEVTAGLAKYTLALVQKLGNTNARVRSDASDALMAMARSNSVGPAYIAIVLLKKPKKEVPTAYRPILGRMTVLQTIIEEFGFFKDLSLDAIMVRCSLLKQL